MGDGSAAPGRADHGLPPSALDIEMLGYCTALTWAGIEMLRASAVEGAVVARLTGAFAIGRAWAVERGDSWAPAAKGEAGAAPRLVLAVREAGVLVDMAALGLTTPDSWALRTGAGLMLGFDHWAERARIEPRGPLRIHANPVRWLQGGATGICVLRWCPESVAQLRSLGPGVTLVADDDATADALAEQLQWHGLPQVAAAPEIEARGEIAA